ncbi:hypothetical protein LL253_13305 [Sphingobium soli]|jgi:hypothetical protein|uniref:Uncharacterized protein n=1 Tax=Sphingobium soli TaxID=1591116 RepID=A0ABS8H549_9SPHN|nr:hypothetical protein [Sphingobium soli]MCC4233664.1 hypothetical protein [Sphingobium soli]|tara:strand:- start:334 stop:597 length:264 start_codon:yes stop_codon:yes gene_type:complete
MSSVATQVLATISAPYGTDLSAHELAKLLIDVQSANAFNALVFSFFSEVPPGIQRKFLIEMGVDALAVRKVADQFSRLSGCALPLAT